MKAELTERRGAHAQIRIEIPAEDFSKAIDRAFKRLVKKAHVPGFRKGMVPRKVFEAIYGRKVIYDEAIEDLAPSAYEEALKELDLEPIARPRISFLQVEEGSPLVFTVDLVLKPEVKLGDYRNIEVPEEKIEVTEDMVNSVLREYQEHGATFEEIKDRGASLGDLLLIEFKSNDSEEWKKAQMILEEEFKAALEGANVGEERELEIKGERFKIRILGIREKRLPELNDQFAAHFGFNSLEEWKKNIKDALEEELKRRAEESYKERVIEKLVEISEIEIPEEAITEEMEYLKESDRKRAQERGLRIEEVLKRAGVEEGKIDEYYRRRAERRLKREFVLEALAKEEGINVTQEEFEEELKNIAAENNVPYEKVKAFWGSEEKASILKSDIIKRKTINKLVEIVKRRGDDHKDADSGSNRTDP